MAAGSFETHMTRYIVARAWRSYLCHLATGSERKAKERLPIPYRDTIAITHRLNTRTRSDDEFRHAVVVRIPHQDFDSVEAMVSYQGDNLVCQIISHEKILHR